MSDGTIVREIGRITDAAGLVLIVGVRDAVTLGSMIPGAVARHRQQEELGSCSSPPLAAAWSRAQIDANTARLAAPAGAVTAAWAAPTSPWATPSAWSDLAGTTSHYAAQERARWAWRCRGNPPLPGHEPSPHRSGHDRRRPPPRLHRPSAPAAGAGPDAGRGCAIGIERTPCRDQQRRGTGRAAQAVGTPRHRARPRPAGRAVPAQGRARARCRAAPG